eukprot:2044987-Rhodomonas_salina.1
MARVAGELEGLRVRDLRSTPTLPASAPRFPAPHPALEAARVFVMTLLEEDVTATMRMRMRMHAGVVWVHMRAGAR